MFRSKKEIVKQQVVQAILSGRYAAGVYLRQNTIADEFGLSSTPVREALTELQTSGLLVHHAHRGFQVAEISKDRVRDAYQARRIIEIAAAELAVPHVTETGINHLRALLSDMERFRKAREFQRMMNANDSFHRTIFAMSGNSFLVETIERLWNWIPRFAPWMLEGRQLASINEHRAILDALAAGDRSAVAAAYGIHLDNACKTFLEKLAGPSQS